MAIISLFGMLIALGMFLLHIALSVWVYRDCRRFGRSAEFSLVALVAVLLFPVMGIIVYLIIRRE